MKLQILKREQRGDYRYFEVLIQHEGQTTGKPFYWGGVVEKVSGKQKALETQAMRWAKEALRDLEFEKRGRVDMQALDTQEVAYLAARLIKTVTEAECVS